MDLDFQMCDCKKCNKSTQNLCVGFLWTTAPTSIAAQPGSVPAGIPLELQQGSPWLIEFQFTGLIMVASLHCSAVFAWTVVLNRRRPVPLEQRAAHHAASELWYSHLVYHGSC